jgi:hypothetical protein
LLILTEIQRIVGHWSQTNELRELGQLSSTTWITACYAPTSKRLSYSSWLRGCMVPLLNSLSHWILNVCTKY